MARLEVLRDGNEPPVRRWTERLADAWRSFTLGPYNLKDPELSRIFGGRVSSTGMPVSESTAMTLSAVWQAVTLISGHVGALPLLLYKRLPNGGKERYEGHPTFRLLHSAPNPEMSAVTFRETLTAHLLLWGNAYAEIERDQAHRPLALWPIQPFRVMLDRDTPQSPLVYRVANGSGSQVTITPSNMLHVRGLSDDGIVGLSVIAKARESLGLGLATERFGATFFGNGATVGGVIRFPPGAAGSPQAREGLRQAIEARHQGVDRAHKMLTLYDGGEYQPIGVPPEDAQFLQTRKFQIEEVARWFNLPVHKLKNLDRSTNNNIEHQALEYLTDCLWLWLRRWESEINRKLISPLEQNIQFAEFLLEGLLRGDAAGRASFYRTMREIGAMTANEIRARENLNPLPDGDTLWQQPNGAAL